MTLKELIKILKRFPNAAQVIINDDAEPTVAAQVNETGAWKVKIIEKKSEKTFDKPSKS